MVLDPPPDAGSQQLRGSKEGLMSKTTGFLVAMIIVLVAALAYSMGQQDSDGDLLAGLLDDEAEASENAGDQEEAAAPAAPPVRAVRIGTEGPREYACKAVAVVANLAQTGVDNDFLSVRQAPTTRGTQIDKLGTGHPVILCDQNESGSWLGVVYQNDGLPPGDRCGVIAPVASARAYDGPCQSGWVYSRYIEVAR